MKKVVLSSQSRLVTFRGRKTIELVQEKKFVPSVNLVDTFFCLEWSVFQKKFVPSLGLVDRHSQEFSEILFIRTQHKNSQEFYRQLSQPSR